MLKITVGFFWGLADSVDFPAKGIAGGELVVRKAERMPSAQGSGGIGAISIGISDTLIGLVILAVIAFGIWKLAKLVWAAFG